MNMRRLVFPIVLCSLVGLSVTGLVLTRTLKEEARDADVATGKGRPDGAPEKAGRPRRERRVDTRTLLTARSLSALAESKEEQLLAKQSERLADHAVDLAFADALRQAVENPPPETPEIREFNRIKGERQAVVTEDNKRIQQLQKRLERASEPDAETLQAQLEVLKAQLELDQDELLEASEDLERVGGDPQAKVRRLKEAYEAAQKEPRPLPAAKEAVQASTSLMAKIRRWRFQSSKLSRLRQAQQDAQGRVKRMTDRRTKAVAKLKAESEGRDAIKQRAAQAVGASASREEAEAALHALRQQAYEQRRVTELGKRIQDYQDLSEVYQNWSELVEGYRRLALNQVFRGLIWVLGVLLGALLVGRLVEHIFHGVSKEEPSQRTLQNLFKFGIHFVGAVVVLFITFGTPTQVTTILGLAGAGLTVALKDFIVAFFGWFILMGRNGIRVGDWVEIRGVGGEVVEVGPLHTVILETGAWSDSGHPTGRRVSFVNNFAMEGHYFNFTTSGQWMWDELHVLIPHGQDPYPIMEGIQERVEAATSANAQVAEQEWRKATTRYRVRSFSAVPGLQLRPSKDGVELRVRYITRAFERHETRKNLYKEVLDLMHQKG